MRGTRPAAVTAAAAAAWRARPLFSSLFLEMRIFATTSRRCGRFSSSSFSRSLAASSLFCSSACNLFVIAAWLPAIFLLSPPLLYEGAALRTCESLVFRVCSVPPIAFQTRCCLVYRRRAAAACMLCTVAIGICVRMWGACSVPTCVQLLRAGKRVGGKQRASRAGVGKSKWGTRVVGFDVVATCVALGWYWCLGRPKGQCPSPGLCAPRRPRGRGAASSARPPCAWSVTRARMWLVGMPVSSVVCGVVVLGSN
mmetsp:Transcript_10375/g.25736  ORF Transcript_10375/g.25736 Transcript_10375/m.25736 type:complete len:254 (+) Transcript_10375:1450-2211(+)